MLGRTTVRSSRCRDTAPHGLLPQVLVVVDGEQRWLNVQRGLTRVWRRSRLTQSYGLAGPVVIDQVEALVRVALDML